MHAEKLHDIFADIIHDNKEIDYVGQIQRLATAVGTRITKGIRGTRYLIPSAELAGHDI